MKTILAIIGFLAIVFVGYSYVNSHKEASDETAHGTSAATNKADGKNSEKSDVQKQRTPLDWTMEEIQANPVAYFEYAIGDARKKRAEIRAREGEMRVKQKQLARKVQEEQKKSDGLKNTLKIAADAYKAAEAKYASSPGDWVADFPYKGARTPKVKMKQWLVKIKKQSELAKLVSDRTNGVNVQYENSILVAEKKSFELEMAIEHLEANYETAKAGKLLEEIDFNKEEIAKYMDISDAYMAMDGGDAALEALSQGQAVQSDYDAELAEILN